MCSDEGMSVENSQSPLGEQEPQEVEKRDTWEQLKDLIDRGEPKQLVEFMNQLGSGETARALSRLSEDDRSLLFNVLSAEDAANIFDELPEEQAADYIEELSEKKAAEIVEELESDEQADILGQLDVEDAEGILQKMDPEEAREARQLLAYDPETAGGIMITEFLSFPANWTIADLLGDLEKNADTYQSYEILYGYVVDEEEKLMGVLRFRDLLLQPKSTLLTKIMSVDAVLVRTSTPLDDLEELFDRQGFFAVPVVDMSDRLVGVVRRADVGEAVADRAEQTFLAASGILGGEEFRTMPLRERSLRRLVILTVNIGLNLISISVIGFHIGTIEAMTALAMFLPAVSDLSGCSGNQAIAVSIRELALGLIRPQEMMRVVFQEMKVGLINGVVLGSLLGVIAGFWKGLDIGLVIGGALAINCVVAVMLGGLIPMLIKRIRMDPAIASAPILTTLTDACGFFLVLSFASFALSLAAS